MFKSTSENLNHIERVASASTRPRANGRIDMIPPEAREPEEYYNTIKDQYFSLNARFQKNQLRLSELRAKKTLSKDEADERERLKDHQTKTQDYLSDLRRAVHQKGAEAWGLVFSIVAKKTLPLETTIKIAQETDAILGRNQHEVSLKSKGSEDKRKDRRHRMRRRMADQP